MAAFHFTAKIHSRAKGASAVRAAAYRAGERLTDERAGRVEDYTRKSGVIDAAIFAPANAPEWVHDRAALWNRVEARENRRDSQLAQELEISLPRELSDAENWRLITDFARAHLVAEGRICDIAFHKGIAGDGGEHPHAHVLMPVREITAYGFGEKHPDCDWRTFTKRRDRLEELREVWCDFARQRALELGIDLGIDWDHRSFADRGIDLEAQPKLGATAQRLEGEGTAADRTTEQEKVQRSNGARLLARPQIVLEALTQRQSTFTQADLARWVHRHTADDQFQPVMDKARALAICVGRDDHGRERYSTAEMIAIEKRMVETASALADKKWHLPFKADRLDETRLSDEQKDAARHLMQGGDVACLTGLAGAGKSTLLGEVRQELEASGYTLRGAALSGISAEGLENGSGIESRTVASLFYAWDAGREPLGPKDVLVIDEAGMIGSRDLALLIEATKQAKAKLILVGDPEQLQAIEAGAAFRAISEHTGTAQLTEIRRQKVEWQREATRELATGQTAQALARYMEAGDVISTNTDEEARQRLVESWQQARATDPALSRIMLAHARVDVQALNEAARAALNAEGRLGKSYTFDTTHGEREFAKNDRILFLRNERQLEVKNGTLGTVTAMGDGILQVRTDDGKLVTFNPADYKDFGHGYATTVHKAQGVTVDEAYVLATRGFDRHLAYVACSRHRARLTLVHSRDAFPNDTELARILGRERSKDTTLDYREAAPEPQLPEPSTMPAPQKSAAAILAEARRRHAEQLRPDRPTGRERGDFEIEP